jgi:DNA-binding MarR family transcriptional regulator
VSARPRKARAGELVVEVDPILMAVDRWRACGWAIGEHFAAALSLYRADEMCRSNDIALALRPHKLTQSRHEALAVLYFARDGEMPLVTLSERLLVHPTSVTSTVDSLEHLGFVERVAHPSDRRTTLARITAAGRRAMEQSSARIAETKCGLGALDERQAVRLFNLLATVRAEAGDMQRVEGPHAGRRVPRVEDPVVVADRNWANQGWDAGPYFRVALSIYRTADLIRRSNDVALRPHQLTHTRHEALAMLYFSQRGEMMMSTLGKRLVVHPTSVTGTVDALERLGLVDRVAHPDDRRATLARITLKGRRTFEATNDAMAETQFGLGALTDDQAKALTKILAVVRLAG